MRVGFIFWALRLFLHIIFEVRDTWVCGESWPAMKDL